MGLTKTSTGSSILNNLSCFPKKYDFTVALAGNPNVRKIHYL